jgi:hypothetical protein
VASWEPAPARRDLRLPPEAGPRSMQHNPALARLVRLAEVSEPASPTSAGAVFLRDVAAAFARYEPDICQMRVVDTARMADLSLPADPDQKLASAHDLGIMFGAVEPQGTRATLVGSATEGLHQAALRLLVALLVERRRNGCLASSTPPALGGAHDGRRLTGDEDARLRTLSAMRSFGRLAPDAEATWSALRERDLRAAVREPDAVTIVPVTDED